MADGVRASKWVSRYPKCADCIYLGNDVPCDYFFITGNTPQYQGVRLDYNGKGGCALKKVREDKRKIKRERVPVDFSENSRRKTALLDRPEVFAMYDKGALDTEIAAEVGVDVSAVITWRNRHNLPRNGQAATRSRYDIAEMERLYNSGANDKEISEALGINVKTAWKWRHNRHLPVNRGLVAKLDDFEAFRLYNSGASDAEIGAALGVSRKVARKWREKKGLPSNYGREKDE